MIRSSKGLSVIEVLIGMAITVIVAGASCQFVSQTCLNMVHEKFEFAKTRIFLNVVSMAGLPASLRYSLRASENVVLRDEIYGDVFTTMNPNTEIPFRLYSPILNETSTGFQLSTALTGDAATPTSPEANFVRYDLNGDVCDTAATTCSPDEFPIQVSTYAELNCPPLSNPNSMGAYWYGPLFHNGLIVPDSCYGPGSVRITIIMEPTPGQSGNALFGLGDQFAPVTTTVMLNNDAVVTAY